MHWATSTVTASNVELSYRRSASLSAAAT
jgi:hypothetical protein